MKNGKPADPAYDIDVASKYEYIDINLWISYNINKGQSWRRSTQCDCKIDWLWVPSPLEEVKYLFIFIFSFLRSDVEVKRIIEFHHSTCNASRTRRKVGNGVS